MIFFYVMLYIFILIYVFDERYVFNSFLAAGLFTGLVLSADLYFKWGA